MSTSSSINLALTPGLLRWLETDPSWSERSWHWRAVQRWRAYWGGVNARQSELLNDSPGTQSTLADPTFIVGPWRSGTTVLHELLAAATGAVTPQTWQCMNAPAFRLSRSPSTAMSVARPMDGLTISAESPQEDEFAMLSLGIASAYRAFLMPHRVSELAHTLDQSYWLENSDWMPRWEQFLRGVVQSSPGRQPLLLKSPNHTFRLQALLKRFPSARFIWTARDPVNVFHSNRKMWRSMFAAHGISAERPADLDDFLTLALDRAAETLDWLSTNLAAEQWAICTQASLRSTPDVTIAQICEQLSLPMVASASRFRQALDSTARGRVDQYIEALPARAHRAADRLKQAQSLAG